MPIAPNYTKGMSKFVLEDVVSGLYIVPNKFLKATKVPLQESIDNFVKAAENTSSPMAFIIKNKLPEDIDYVGVNSNIVKVINNYENMCAELYPKTNMYRQYLLQNGNLQADKVTKKASWFDKAIYKFGHWLSTKL